MIKKLIPSFIINFYHFFIAFLGNFLFGFPSKKIKVIGITGTNGKSTVVEMVSKILEEAGYKTAFISSIKFKIREREEKNLLKMTMPGRFRIQRFLKKALKKNCDYAIIEVTSEGIKQYRHKFINFQVSAITNLTPEHIESHGGFENYKKTKGELFKKTKKIHILNLDDQHLSYFLKFPASQKIGYTISNTLPQSFSPSLKIVKGEVLNENPCEFNVISETKKIKIKLKLSGKFNIQNALCAICVGLSQNIPLEICKKGLEKIEKIEGRMEEIVTHPFKVIVDYAHTPDALEKVYKNFKNQTLVCVLGSAGGGRDKWKRKELGRIAQKYCQKIILTNEDPYDEDPQKIIEEIEKGIITKKEVFKILDRKEAIKKALKIANKGDVVVITGKGCEPWMCVAHGKKIPWDDREIVKKEIKKLYEKI